jgi:hypothetical protein
VLRLIFLKSKLEIGALKVRLRFAVTSLQGRRIEEVIDIVVASFGLPVRVVAHCKRAAELVVAPFTLTRPQDMRCATEVTGTCRTCG